MNFKKIIAALAVISMLPITAFAAEYNIDSVDLETNKVKVSGKLDAGQEEVMILVTAENADWTQPNQVKYQWVKDTEEDGSFNFEFEVMPFTGEASGFYDVLITAKSLNGAPLTGKKFYFGTDTDKDSLITVINAATSVFDIYNNIAGGLETCAENFSVEAFEPYISTIADGASDTIAQALVDDNFAAGDYAAVQACMQEAAILYCYKESLDTAIADSSSNLKNAELVFGATATNSVWDKLYADYEDLNATGKVLVLNKVKGNSYADYSELREKLAEAVVIASILNTNNQGGGHISNVCSCYNKSRI